MSVYLAGGVRSPVVGNVGKKIIRQALTPAESPKEIIFVKALPLNSSGKVDKSF